MTNYLIAAYLISALCTMWIAAYSMNWKGMSIAQRTAMSFVVYCPVLNTGFTLWFIGVEVYFLFARVRSYVVYGIYWRFILKQNAKFRLREMNRKGVDQFIKDEMAVLEMLLKASKR